MPQKPFRPLPGFLRVNLFTTLESQDQPAETCLAPLEDGAYVISKGLPKPLKLVVERRHNASGTFTSATPRESFIVYMGDPPPDNLIVWRKMVNGVLHVAVYVPLAPGFRYEHVLNRAHNNMLTVHTHTEKINCYHETFIEVAHVLMLNYTPRLRTFYHHFENIGVFRRYMSKT